MDTHAEGNGTRAKGNSSHAEGKDSQALGSISHAEGYYTTASGDFSHSEGYGSVANGNKSHSEGHETQVHGTNSHVEGNRSEVWSDDSHAEGYNSKAYGENSHAECRQTVAEGRNSHTEGDNTIARNTSEHAQGQYNKSNKVSETFGDSGNTIHSIGIGTSDADRKNAVEVMQDGRVFIKDVGSYLGNNATETNIKDLATVINEKTSKAFSNIKVGSTILSAVGDDTVELTAGANVTLLADPVEKKIAIHASGGGGGGTTQIQADWNQTDATQLDYIKNKPTKVSDFENDAGYVSSANISNKADKAIPASSGNFASLDSTGNLMDSGKKAADFATPEQITTLENSKVDKESGKGLSTNDFTNDDKTKLAGIQAGAQINQNAFSNVNVGSKSITAANQTDQIEVAAGTNITLDVDLDHKKITINSNAVTEQLQADWTQTDQLQLDYIKNKPTIPAAQVNSDWNATSGLAQILNKPTLGTAAAKNVPSSGNASTSQVVMGNDTRLTDARTPLSHSHTELVAGDTTLKLQSDGQLLLTYNGYRTILRPRWMEWHVQVKNVASGWSFRRGDDSNWDNVIKFLVWGAFAYIVGNVKRTTAMTADTTYSNIGTVTCPTGYTIQSQGTCVSLEGVMIGITGSENISIRTTKALSANDVLTIRLFAPCILQV